MYMNAYLYVITLWMHVHILLGVASEMVLVSGVQVISNPIGKISPVQI